jgi:hypothetical protein
VELAVWWKNNWKFYTIRRCQYLLMPFFRFYQVGTRSGTRRVNLDQGARSIPMPQSACNTQLKLCNKVRTVDIFVPLHAKKVYGVSWDIAPLMFTWHYTTVSEYCTLRSPYSWEQPWYSPVAVSWNLRDEEVGEGEGTGRRSVWG